MEKINKYLTLISNQEIKDFCLSKCKFIFGDLGFLHTGLYAYYVGFVNGKYLIRFKYENPKPLTFFHEVSHAYLGHKPASDNNLYEQQEKEADNLAIKLLKQNVT